MPIDLYPRLEDRVKATLCACFRAERTAVGMTQGFRKWPETGVTYYRLQLSAQARQ